MNILYHHRTQGKGVEGVHIEKLAEALCFLNNEVDILGPRGIKKIGEQEGKLKSKSFLYKFISKYVPEMIFEIIEIMYNFIAVKKIGNCLKEKKYGLIYERYAIFNWAGIKMAKKAKLPIILEVNYTASTPLYRKRSILLKPLARFIDKIIFKRANGIVVVSGYLRKQLINMGIKKEKIIVLPNAADPDQFNNEITGELIKDKYELRGKKVIGFVGGFYPWHGVDMLIEVFKRMDKYLDDIALLLVGDGPLKTDLEEQTKQIGLEKNIKFIGKVDHNDLPEYIASFDIAVMPNSNNYGSPMKIYEYMAMGKPVVAPRLGPLQEGINDGIEGKLFEQGDSHGLEKALGEIIRNPILMNRIKVEARKNILENHTWAKNAEKVLSLAGNIRKIKT